MNNKLIRITTVPISLKILLKGQLNYMGQYFNVIAVSSPGNELEEVKEDQNVRVKEIEMSRQITPVKDLVSLYRMVVFLLKEKPEIVHSHTPKAGLIGMLAALITCVPFRLHTVAGLPLMESSGLKRNVLLAVEWLTYRCATHVYPNSLGLKEFILANHLVSDKKVKVLGNGSSNGIDTKYFQVINEIFSFGEDIRHEFKILEGQFIFIFVGRIVRDKGINELIYCFDKLCLNEKNIKLLLVGSFEDKLDPISDRTKNILIHNEHVIEAGFQNDVRPFLAISDCLVFPSYREGFPNVVMQAGAMGLPSIVSDINGCNEIVIDRQNGLIISAKDESALYDAMSEMLLDNDLKILLSENARKLIVGRYDQQFIWAEIKKEYDLLLGN